MRLRDETRSELLASDRLPACACGDLGDPGQRVCDGCGRWLETDDALREKRQRMDEIRPLRWRRAA